MGFSLLLVTTSCSGRATPPAGYVRFHPEQESLFEIEFDHPENWVFLPPSSDKFDNYLIYAPTVQPPPARPTSVQSFPSKWSDILITVFQVSNSQEEMDKSADMTANWDKNKDPSRNDIHSEILENLTGEIDGARSRQLTVRTTVELQGETYVEIYRKILFAKGDRVYSFIFATPEKDSTNDFAKAFEYMISSIRFIH